MNQYILYDVSNDNFISALCYANNEEEAKAIFIANNQCFEDDINEERYQIEQSFIEILGGKK